MIAGFQLSGDKQAFGESKDVVLGGDWQRSSGTSYHDGDNKLPDDGVR